MGARESDEARDCDDNRGSRPEVLRTGVDRYD